MQQAELNRAVARATQETVTTIKQYGFSLEPPPSQAAAQDNVSERDCDLGQPGASREPLAY